MLCQLLLYRKVNQQQVYVYSVIFGFASHLGHHRALSRVPCVIQQVLISYLFYTQQCICVNPNLPVHPTPFSPLGSICLLSMSVSLFLLCKQVRLYNFSRFHIYALIYNIFLFLTYFTLYDSLQVHPRLCKWPNFVPQYGQ